MDKSLAQLLMQLQKQSSKNVPYGVPYDVETTADTIYQAFHMDRTERNRRMQKLRKHLRYHDVHRWVRSFVDVWD
jgi:trehalose-6-phosphate synthase